MALPTNTDLQTMDWAAFGTSFVVVPSNNTVNTFTMDWAAFGAPFVTNPSVSGPSNIGGWDGVSAANLQSLMGTQYTSIETIYGVT
jgi:hypothetical protein